MTNTLPNIYLFNPTCEYAVANGNASWHPNRLLQKMESDLATLPLFVASSGDYILTNGKPSKKFIDSIFQLTTEIPNFADRENVSTNLELINQSKNKLLPWGWSPAAHKKLKPLKHNCSQNFINSPVYNWHSQHRDLYSKKFARGVLKTILDKYPNDHFLPANKLTEVVKTKQEIEDLIARWEKLMVKAPWSSSGRGLQTIRKTPIHPKVWDKLLGIIKEQGYAIVEPYHNKVLDLAFQFILKKGKVKYLGISNFSTDYKGQYNGNSLNGLPDELDKGIVEFANFIPEKIITPLIEIIETTELAQYYEGHFGVDSLIYHNEKDELKINPCLEINVRQNMGLLSLKLENFILPGMKGLFRTYYKPGLSFFQFGKEMAIKHPLKITNDKIESGFFPLTDTSETTLFGAYILV